MAAPRRSVKEMVKDYEENIIQKPVVVEKPIPKPTTIKSKPPIPAPRTKIKPIPATRTIKSKPPVPTPRTNIKLIGTALKTGVQTYEINVKFEDPLKQLNNNIANVENLFKKILVKNKGFKFIQSLTVTFAKQKRDEITRQLLFEYKTAHFNTVK